MTWIKRVAARRAALNDMGFLSVYGKVAFGGDGMGRMSHCILPASGFPSARHDYPCGLPLRLTNTIPRMTSAIPEN